jgi:hypothetical protein
MSLSLVINYQKNLDVISLFRLEDAIHADDELLPSMLQASLRMKHSILIFETKNIPFPVWNISRRWDYGDNWFWLHPRARSILSECYHFSYGELKTFLVSLKS